MNCKTKYPVLLVHGMGFRDGKISYWGRIPAVLEQYGAVVYSGGQEANATVERNALILADTVRRVLAETGAERLNVIAHSKGGLEMRYLISTLKMGGSIASLTTISTPHNGSLAMDKLMRLPKIFLKLVAKVTDIFKRVGGDKKPDTYQCFRQLTTDYAKDFNRNNPDDKRVLYRSCGFLMKNWTSDIFMAIPYIGVKLLNGKSDGFLTPDEVRHGEFIGIFTGVGRRGISHCDEVDLRRNRLSKRASASRFEIADITEFYAELVDELRDKGL